MDPYYLFTDIHCVFSLVQNQTNLGASSVQVLDKFRTSFGQVWTSFVLKLVRERDWIVSFYAQTFLCIYLGTNQTNLGASSGQVPDKFWTSSGQVSDKFHLQTCLRVVRKSNLSASCLHPHRNSWVLYWTSLSCPKNKLVRKLSGVVHHRTTTSVKVHWHMIRHLQLELHFFLIPCQIKNICASYPVIIGRACPN